MDWLVGTGPRDPALWVRRAAQLIEQADVVLAEAAWWPLVRELAPDAHLQLPGPPAVWPQVEVLVRLYPGDGLAASAQDRAGLQVLGRAYDLVGGLDDAGETARTKAVEAQRPLVRLLAGITVVITRAAPQQAALADPLRRLGATVVNLATIAIEPPLDGGAALANAASRLADYRWVVLTSTNGARALLDVVPDGRVLAGVGLAAIGEATAAVLAAAHLPADLVPAQFVAEALLAQFPPPPAEGNRRVLLVRAAVARNTLPDGLRAAGWDVEVVSAYQTVRAAPSPAALVAMAGADVVLFSSPSTVTRFIEAVGPDGAGVRRHRAGLPPSLAVIAIGPVTAAAAVAAGLRVDVVATRYDVAGLVEAMCRWAEGRQGRRK